MTDIWQLSERKGLLCQEEPSYRLDMPSNAVSVMLAIFALALCAATATGDGAGVAENHAMVHQLTAEDGLGEGASVEFDGNFPTAEEMASMSSTKISDVLMQKMKAVSALKTEETKEYQKVVKNIASEQAFAQQTMVQTGGAPKVSTLSPAKAEVDPAPVTTATAEEKPVEAAKQAVILPSKELMKDMEFEGFEDSREVGEGNN